MLYYRCPTCKTILGNKQIPYEEAFEKICNTKLTREERAKKMKELLDNLELPRLCCRQKILSYVKLIEVLV